MKYLKVGAVSDGTNPHGMMDLSQIEYAITNDPHISLRYSELADLNNHIPGPGRDPNSPMSNTTINRTGTGQNLNMFHMPYRRTPGSYMPHHAPQNPSPTLSPIVNHPGILPLPQQAFDELDYAAVQVLESFSVVPMDISPDISPNMIMASATNSPEAMVDIYPVQTHPIVPSASMAWNPPLPPGPPPPLVDQMDISPSPSPSPPPESSPPVAPTAPPAPTLRGSRKMKT